MEPGSEDILQPIQYEAIQQSDIHSADIQNVGDFALSHFSFIAENNAESTELSGISQESKNSFESIQYLKDLPQDKEVYSDPIALTNQSKGMLQSGNDLFIQIDHSNPDAHVVRATTQPEKADENTPQPSRILAITGSSDGKFTCVIETGPDQKKVISIPREVMYQAQLLSQQNEVLAGITDESTKKVVQAYIDNLQGKEPTTQIDQQTLIEAAKNSGQVTTDSLRKYVEKAIPEKPGDDAFNERRQRIIDGLNSHTVASQEDFVTVLSFTGPEELTKYQGELTVQISEKRKELAGVKGTPEEARVMKELDDLNAKLQKAKDAEDFYNDPKKLSTFVDTMTSGRLSKEQAAQISEHFENGDTANAMREMAIAKINTLTPDQKEKLTKIFGMKPTEAMLAATGGALLLLIILMMNGLEK